MRSVRYALPFVALFFVAALPCGAAADGQALRLSDPVAVTSEHEVFGAPLPESAEVLSLSQLLESPDTYLGAEVQVDTRIARVCQKKGCFFIAQEGEAAVRVSFKDYGFFIPTDSAGKYVRLAGVLQRQDISPGEAKHMNEDIGAPDSQNVVAGPTFTIVASAVRIPRG